jgi:hypothetical protein
MQWDPGGIQKGLGFTRTWEASIPNIVGVLIWGYVLPDSCSFFSDVFQQGAFSDALASYDFGVDNISNVVILQEF